MGDNVIEFLEKRGMIDALTHQDLKKAFEQPRKVYLGIDPTADSLHLGNLAGIVFLKHFQNFGHTPVCLVGGATALVGDPSGKSKERPLLDTKTVQKNQEGILRDLKRLLDFKKERGKAILLNNDEWFSQMGFVEFLRDVGKHFRLGTMLSKESVKTRLESEEGMSFTELAYQLLQGYDFYHLLLHHDVSVQIGGSDQWGNIVAGCDLVRRFENKQVYGLTFPLLTRSDGKKFGKSESGAIWLSPEKVSPYQLYQYLYGVPDVNVIFLMKMLTFMDLEEIQHYASRLKHQSHKPNEAQKKLAEEVTAFVHGQEGLEKALRATQGMNPGKETHLDLDLLQELGEDIPSLALSLHEVLNVSILDILVKVKAFSTKGEARRMIRNGGVYLNNKRLLDEKVLLLSENLLEGKLFVLSVGKKKKIIVKVK